MFWFYLSSSSVIQTSCLYWNYFTDWNEKNYRIWFLRFLGFLPTSGLSSCGISQGEIISVNWLLCYRFFVLFNKSTFPHIQLAPSCFNYAKWNSVSVSSLEAFSRIPGLLKGRSNKRKINPSQHTVWIKYESASFAKVHIDIVWTLYDCITLFSTRQKLQDYSQNHPIFHRDCSLESLEVNCLPRRAPAAFHYHVEQQNSIGCYFNILQKMHFVAIFYFTFTRWERLMRFFCLRTFWKAIWNGILMEGVKKHIHFLGDMTCFDLLIYFRLFLKSKNLFYLKLAKIGIM